MDPAAQPRPAGSWIYQRAPDCDGHPKRDQDFLPQFLTYFAIGGIANFAFVPLLYMLSKGGEKIFSGYVIVPLHCLFGGVMQYMLKSLMFSGIGEHFETASEKSEKTQDVCGRSLGPWRLCRTSLRVPVWFVSWVQSLPEYVDPDGDAIVAGSARATWTPELAKKFNASWHMVPVIGKAGMPGILYVLLVGGVVLQCFAFLSCLFASKRILRERYPETGAGDSASIYNRWNFWRWLFHAADAASLDHLGDIMRDFCESDQKAFDTAYNDEKLHAEFKVCSHAVCNLSKLPLDVQNMSIKAAKEKCRKDQTLRGFAIMDCVASEEEEVSVKFIKIGTKVNKTATSRNQESIRCYLGPDPHEVLVARGIKTFVIIVGEAVPEFWFQVSLLALTYDELAKDLWSLAFQLFSLVTSLFSILKILPKQFESVWSSVVVRDYRVAAVSFCVVSVVVSLTVISVVRWVGVWCCPSHVLNIMEGCTDFEQL